jgi:hypothetical protein
MKLVFNEFNSMSYFHSSIVWDHQVTRAIREFFLIILDYNPMVNDKYFLTRNQVFLPMLRARKIPAIFYVETDSDLIME